MRSHTESACAENASPLVLDTWSSASRQHYIDTGSYLLAEETGRDEGDGLRALLAPDDLECALRTLAELRDLGRSTPTPNTSAHANAPSPNA